MGLRIILIFKGSPSTFNDYFYVFGVFVPLISVRPWNTNDFHLRRREILRLPGLGMMMEWLASVTLADSVSAVSA